MSATVLIGAGGHAESLINAMGREAFSGCVTPQASECGLPWLGSDESFLNSDADSSVHIAVVAGRNGNMTLRRRIIDMYAGRPHATLVAPSAIVAGHTELGDGCAVMCGAIINGATLGMDCVVNTGAVIEHACRLADNVFVGPNATLCGGVEIGADTFIGAGATVINGVNICGGAVIGAGAVVTRDVTEPGVYAGVPALKIG